MKRLLQIFLTFLFATIPLVGQALTFTQGNLTYTTISGTTNEVSVEATNTSITSAIIPESVENNRTVYMVSTIGDIAFYGCSSLAEITIPNSVTTIGSSAFQNCHSLAEITIPNSVTTIGSSAFQNCPSLAEVTIGNSVTSIGDYVFWNCSSLAEITIPNSVTSIGSHAFDICTGLKEVTIEDGETTLSLGYNSYSGQFGDCPLEKVYIGRNLSYKSGYSYGYSPFEEQTKLVSVTIGQNVTSLDKYLFSNCSSLAEITLGNSVTSIGEYAFRDCSSLAEIHIPNSVTSIGEYAFRGCYSLAEITLGNSVTSIGEYAFSSCTSLAEITIPNSVTSIDSSAFSSCTSLAEITIGNSVTSIGEYAFRGCTSLAEITLGNSVTSIGYSAFYGCSSLAELTIPNSVTTIGYYAFNGCTGLKEVTIEDGETTLSLDYSLYSKNGTGSGQFGDCPLEKVYIGRNLSYEISYSYGYSPFANQKSLASVKIGANVTSLGEYLFYSCSSLAEITIGNSVTSIGEYAFSSCTSLAEITIPNSVTSIGNYVFSGCSGLKDVTLEDGETTLSLGYNYYSSYNTGQGLFRSCPLEKVYIGRNLSYSSGNSYGYSPFANITNLVSVTIGQNVSSLEKDLFYGCTNIQSIDYNPGDELLNLDNTVFDSFFDNASLFIHSPEKTFEILFDHTWNKFTKIFYKEEEKIYVPSLWEPKLTSFNAYVSFENSCLSEVGSTVNLQADENVLMAVFQSVDILSQLQSENGFSFVPSISWKLNYIYGASSDSNESRTVSVKTAGNLFNELGLQDIERITCLKISGDLNGTDIMTINRMTPLKYLDISDANIVEGGQTYRENLKTQNSVIGSYFFSDCKNLTNIILSNSALTIDSNAFDGMSNIVNIVIGKSTKTISTYAFQGCANLGSITIPNSVTSIGNYAFNGCSKLKEVTLEDGDSTLSLGNNSSSSRLFVDCPLEKVYIGRNLSYNSGYTYGYSPFENKTQIVIATIGSNVTSLGEYLFYNCSSLAEITIPNSVTTIGYSAFYGCSSLAEITIPNSVTSIGNAAFSGCTSLKEVTIEDGGTTLSLGYNSSSSGQFGNSPLEKIYIGRNLSYKSGSSYGYSPFANQKNLASVKIEANVTSLGEYLFFNCSSLAEITIGNSVTSIGNAAFSGCTSLKEVTIEDGETTLSLGYNYYSSSGTGSGQFSDCPLEKIYIGRNLSYSSGSSYGYSPFASKKSLVSVMLGSNVTSLSTYLFYNCYSLAEITIPNSVTSIGESAFNGCSGLKKVNISDIFAWCHISFKDKDANPLTYGKHLYLNGSLLKDDIVPEGITEINNYTFYNGIDISSVSIPNSVTSIGSSAFYGCSSLSEITIGNSVTSIGHYVFRNCTSLAEITIPNSVTSIGGSAFEGCTSLAEITIPNSVTSIGGLAFYGCTSLAEITIPNSVTSIEFFTFEGCTSLAEITIPNSVTSIGNAAFRDCSSLAEINIPNSVTSIGIYAFYGCKKATELKLSESLTQISQYAFNGCSSLTSINIPENVGSIADYAFANCTNLEDLTLNINLTSIGNNGFANCSNLAKIRSLNPTPPVITTSVFRGVDKESCQLIVTKDNLVYYWLDPVWKEFLNISDDMVYLSPLPEVTYGAEPVDLSLYAPEGVSFTYETSNPDVALIDGSMLSIVGAGTATVGALYDQSGTPMEIIGQMRQFIVDKAELTASVPETVIYEGQELPQLTISLEGFCYDDTVSDIEEMPTAFCDITPTSAPGEYPITFSGGMAANYNFVFADSKVIVKEKRKISVSNIENIKYGDKPVNLSQYTPEGEELIYSTADSDLAVIENNILTIKKAGNVKIKVSLPEGTEDAIVVTPEVVLTIEKADLIIGVENVTIEIGQQIPPFTLIAEGLVYDDTLEDVGILPSAYCDANEGSEPGDYAIDLEGGESENYNLILVDGILTILESGTTNIQEIPVEGDNIVRAFNYNGVLLYDGPEDEMVLEKGIYIIVKGKESQRVMIK